MNILGLKYKYSWWEFDSNLYRHPIRGVRLTNPNKSSCLDLGIFKLSLSEPTAKKYKDTSAVL